MAISTVCLWKANRTKKKKLLLFMLSPSATGHLTKGSAIFDVAMEPGCSVLCSASSNSLMWLLLCCSLPLWGAEEGASYSLCVCVCVAVLLSVCILTHLRALPVSCFLFPHVIGTKKLMWHTEKVFCACWKLSVLNQYCCKMYSSRPVWADMISPKA